MITKINKYTADFVNTIAGYGVQISPEQYDAINEELNYIIKQEHIYVIRKYKAASEIANVTPEEFETILDDTIKALQDNK